MVQTHHADNGTSSIKHLWVSPVHVPQQLEQPEETGQLQKMDVLEEAAAL